MKESEITSKLAMPLQRAGHPLFARTARRPLHRLALLFVLFTAVSLLANFGPLEMHAQVSTEGSKPVAQPQPLPLTTQIKKTIVFLESDCIHDFGPQLSNLAKEKVAQLPAQQQATINLNLTSLIAQLIHSEKIKSKLSPEESGELQRHLSNVGISGTELPAEIEWKANAVVKMTTFTAEEIAALTPQDVAILPMDQHRGTGFLIGLVDPRLIVPAGQTGKRFFRYLVTNRHVVEPGIELGTPCKVVSSFILMNRKPDTTHPTSYSELTQINKMFTWTFPDDDSVDLALAPIGFNQDEYDQYTIPTDQFVSEEEMQDHKIVEGDSVLFAGLFIQTFDQVHRLEPIVRSGTLAMIPGGMLETTLQRKQGHVYLAEAHAFGGNSGSPVFVDPNRFAGIISGPMYKFLGVISGEVPENSDLSLTVTTSISGNIAANSGVSVVVPGSELMKVLNKPALQKDRDSMIEHEAHLAETTQK
jgi:hypothetical protein